MNLTTGLGGLSSRWEADRILSKRICDACPFGMSPSVSYLMVRLPSFGSRHRIAQPVKQIGLIAVQRLIEEHLTVPLGRSARITDVPGTPGTASATISSGRDASTVSCALVSGSSSTPAVCS